MPLLVEDDDGVRLVTLNRPERLNAVTAEVWRAIADALTEAAADPAVHVVLLRGAGSGFCSGVDLRELQQTDPRALTAAFRAAVEALIDFPKPLLAAVHGVAVGFGMTILLHCDVVLVADDARLRLPFAALRTAPEACSSWLLAQRIGAHRAADLLLTGRFLSGREAVEMGVAARCHPADQVDGAARTVARELTAVELPALVAAKSLMRTGWAAELRATLQRELDAARALSRELGPISDQRFSNNP